MLFLSLAVQFYYGVMKLPHIFVLPRYESVQYLLERLYRFLDEGSKSDYSNLSLLPQR
jgi:hypothetical protein